MVELLAWSVVGFFVVCWQITSNSFLAASVRMALLAGIGWLATPSGDGAYVGLFIGMAIMIAGQVHADRKEASRKSASTGRRKARAVRAAS